MESKSRAEYYRKRRKDRKQFAVLLDRKKVEALENKLQQENKTKAAWLNEKIDEELNKCFRKY